jgi:hypothetical protein
MVLSKRIDIDDVLTCIKTAVRLAHTHEDIRIRASRCIEEKILEPLGIPLIGRYEYMVASGGRADALYGHVIIEYKTPGELSTSKGIAGAKKQIIKYIKDEAKTESKYKDFLGVILSDKIAFIKYDPRSKQWLLRGPYEMNRETMIKLIEALRGLRRKKLAVEELLIDFGPKSIIAQRTVKILYHKLINTKSLRVKLIFEDWMRLFSQATGYSPSKLKDLEKNYGFRKNVNYNALLFSIHTYYAIVMKLLAAEIAYLYGTGRWIKSYISELEDAYMRGIDSFKDVLEELESGGIFKKLLGITNFIEGDYFSWYLDELDKELADTIAEIARRLSDYEPATPQLEPEFTRDLLKRLYQNLIPKKIRHNLGEYYTPDWLAELVLNEVGFNEDHFEELAQQTKDLVAPLKLRLLDPACGSGTFLVLAIKKLRNYAEKHYLLDILPDYLLKNIIGFDLNPLAVLASRTNYLLAIADLITYVKGMKEIPVYLADSILVETSPKLFGPHYVLRTVAGKFEIPKLIVDKGLLSELLNLIDKSLRSLYDPEEFIELVKSKLKINNVDYNSLKNLYDTFLKLEREDKNHIWVSIIRNAFAPLLVVGTNKENAFDFIVGNPPWVNWENLPESYRKATNDLWNKYGLTITKGKTGLGKVKRDLAMLFLTRSLHLYLKRRGKLGFLLPLTTFKTQAGAGFRRFLAYGKKIDTEEVPCKIIRVHDLVTLYPFEGAINRTAMIVIEKEGTTNFPIEHIVWDNPSKKPIDVDTSLDQIKEITRRYKIVLMPLEGIYKPESSWMQTTMDSYNVLTKIITSSTISTKRYRAYEGVNTALNQVYWIKIKDKISNEILLITNPLLPGQKKKVKQVDALIEADLVYPLIRGKEVKKWHVKSDLGYIILPVDNKGATILSAIMKVKYSNAWTYFLKFVHDLINRGGEPYKSKLEPYRKVKYNRINELLEKIPIIEKRSPPFYWLFNVSPSLSSYKVVWKYIAGAIRGKAKFSCAVLEPIHDRYVGYKTVIPNEKLMLVPLDKAEEAYYLAGVLNSSYIRALVASYMIETAISTHLLDYIYVPKYNPNSNIHKNIAELSKKAHIITKDIVENGKKELIDELKRIELELDKWVSKLYGLPESSVKSIRKLLYILLGEE